MASKRMRDLEDLRKELALRWKRWKHNEMDNDEGSSDEDTEESVNGSVLLKPSGDMPSEPPFQTVDPKGHTEGIEALGVRFLPQQKRLIERIAGCRGLLAWWYMGSGKTLGAIGAALMLVKTGAVEDVLIVVPKSMVPVWDRQVEKAFEDVPGTRVTVLTYGTSILHQLQFDNGVRAMPPVHVTTERTLLIVDEAHNLKKRVEKADHEKGTCGGDALLHCARLAGRVLLLTGTPVVNYLSDLNNLAGALRGLPWDWTRVRYRKNGKGALAELQGRVDLFLPSPEERVRDLGMPERQHHLINLVMSDAFKEYYCRANVIWVLRGRWPQGDYVATAKRPWQRSCPRTPAFYHCIKS